MTTDSTDRPRAKRRLATVSQRQHEAVLAAALDPDHKIPEHFNLRTKHALCAQRLATVRPDYRGQQCAYDATPYSEFHLTAGGRAHAEHHGTPTPRRRIVIISCGARKRDDLLPGEVVPAGELYVGGYHKALRRAADALTAERGAILIASAFHGLVRLTRPLGPYDVRRSDPRAVTAETVRAQALHMGLDDADVLVLGGRAYGSLIQEALPSCIAPLGGNGGMGHQLHILTVWASSSTEGERQRHELWLQAAQHAAPADDSTPTAQNDVDSHTHIR